MLGPDAQIGLLQPAIAYGLDSVAIVTPALLSRPTPCPRWNLHMLLLHVNDSLAALVEGAATGQIAALPLPVSQPATPDVRDVATAAVAVFRERSDRLLKRWPRTCADAVVAVEDRWLATDLMAIAGAIEIAVHGWDIFVAVGHRRPIPRGLADDILAVSSLVVSNGVRRSLFSPPVRVPASASASDRLVALLGRCPN